jgi:tetratricopeptide (TPR) repeat protein
VKFFKDNLVFILVLIVVGSFIYSFNLNNKLFWDDDDWIVNNPAVHSLESENIKYLFTHDALSGIGLESNYYRPFLFLTFAVNWTLGEDNPFSYHILSNILHLANAVLVFTLLLLLFKRKLPAFIAGLLFVLHPLQTEAVTYISGRGDPLNVFFMLIALLLLRHVHKKRLSLFSVPMLLSYIALVFALLSRETAIVFPFLAIIVLITIYRGEGFWRSFLISLKAAIPYFGIVLVYGILRLTILNFADTLNFYTMPNIYSENLHVRVFTFLATLPVYLRLFFVPTGLHMEREMALRLSLFTWPVWLVSISLLLIIIGLILLYKNRRRASDFTVLFFGIVWFFVSISPMSGITPINAQIYEHWMYLPSIGIFFIVGWYLGGVLEYFKKKRLNVVRIALIIALCLYGLWLSIVSIQRNILWKDPIAFYEDILRYNPDSVRINNNLGNKYDDIGEYDKAEHHYRIAISSEDIFAQPHFNLGIILENRGDIEGAHYEYVKAIEKNPRFHYAYQNLAALYAKIGDAVRVTEMLEKLRELTPENPQVYMNLYRAYVFREMRTEAIQAARTGILYARTHEEESAFYDMLTAIGEES